MKLKEALVNLKGSQRYELLRFLLHNLAVVNYCEILDYNDRLYE
jgi:hypothetical protein